MTEMKVLNLKEIQKQISTIKTADKLGCLVEDICNGKVGQQTSLKVLAMVGNHARILLQNNPSVQEHAALSTLSEYSAQVLAPDLEVKYSGNLHKALKTEVAPVLDHAGYSNDDSIYYGRGVSNSG